MRKDKKQIIGEDMTDEAIKFFLNAEPADQMPAPLHKLLRAYHSLRLHDFERFLTFFKAEGLPFDTRDAQGKDFVGLVADQRMAKPYIEVFEEAKATTHA